MFSTSSKGRFSSSVRNPYSHTIPVCEISYSLKSAGREVASGTMPDPGSLTAKDTTRLDVPVKVPYDFLVSLVKDAGRDWDIDYEMRVGLTSATSRCRSPSPASSSSRHSPASSDLNECR